MKAFVVVFTLALVGCKTLHQRSGFTGGYDDMELGNGLYQVSFRGNGFTRGDEVQAGFLRRCAEIAHEQGYDYFAIVDQEASAQQQNLGTSTKGNISRDYYGGYTYTAATSTNTVTRHSRLGMIKLFKEGEQPPLAIRARSILKKYYVLPDEG